MKDISSRKKEMKRLRSVEEGFTGSDREIRLQADISEVERAFRTLQVAFFVVV
jgi:hypothetical protein